MLVLKWCSKLRYGTSVVALVLAGCSVASESLTLPAEASIGSEL
jgi:hypothetical protein